MHNLGSPELQHPPAPPSQGTTFQGQQYANLPDNVVAGTQSVQVLDQMSTRAVGCENVERHQTDH